MSIRFQVKKTIEVPQDKLYHALLDIESAKHWMQGLVRMERLDDGQMKEGSAWKETRKMFGKEASEHFEVVELKDPEKIVLYCDGTKGTTGKGQYVYQYTVTSTGDHSEVTLDGEIKGLTGLAKFFGKMMAGTFRKACEKDLDALKAYLEKKYEKK